ncbi:MAG TPA: glycosyltransferase family 39 protein [Tepidisphaeraceae bacterium]|jgi:hypothetical protein
MDRSAAESKLVRRTGLVAAFVLAVAFFIWTQAYFEPVHVGTDQNGYLVGGKQFSRTLLPRQWPTILGTPTQFDPHAFVSNMWVAGANDKAASFDPKYPIGLPLLYALLIWASAGGTTAAFYLSPIAMALTLPAVFIVVRRFSGTYGGLLGMLAFATSPLTAALVNNPNSHAVNVFTATWGMAAVLHWWHVGGRRWAIFGGLLVGYSATVRYSEGLLVLPLLWAALVRPVARRTPVDLGMIEPAPPWPSRMARRWFEPLLLLAAWAAPVIALAAYNLLLLGTLTGYDSTNESTGFGWVYFFDNWEALLRNLAVGGLFLMLPLAIIGMVRTTPRDPRRAVFLLLWAWPCLGLYAFYYWGPDGVGMLRFITTSLPPLLAFAFWGLLPAGGRIARPVSEPTAPEPTAAVPDAVGQHSRRHAALRVAVRTVFVLCVAAAAGVVVFYSVRFDRDKQTLAPLQTYLERAPTAYQRTGATVAFFAGIVAAVAIAGALAATSRRSTPVMAAGLVTLLSVSGGADASRFWLEQNAYDTRMWQATARAVRERVPDGAMLVCRDEPLLNYLQFVTDNRLYSGQSFDRNWVNGRPRALSDDPVLMDPVRGQRLFDAIKGDQAALNEQARATVRAALSTNRRVFVLEAVASADPLRQALRKKEEGPVPDFVRRYITGSKNPVLVGRRVDWWTVPQVVKDEFRSIPRGRKPLNRPNFRTTCFQVWEITAG